MKDHGDTSNVLLEKRTWLVCIKALLFAWKTLSSHLKWIFWGLSNLRGGGVSILSKPDLCCYNHNSLGLWLRNNSTVPLPSEGLVWSWPHLKGVMVTSNKLWILINKRVQCRTWNACAHVQCLFLIYLISSTNGTLTAKTCFRGKESQNRTKRVCQVSL